MKRALLRFAERIYRRTPSSRLRSFYYAAFCAAVRGRRTVADLDGVVFDLDLSETIDVALFLRQYEPDVTAALDQHCRPGMTVLDIGANIGAHTLRLGKLVGPEGRVFAFEPTDYAFEKLTRNLSLNSLPHVTAVRVALADQCLRQQEITFRSSWRTDRQSVETRSTVDFVSLDDWARAHRVERVDLVKMDVDGNEFSVLSGGMGLLSASRPTFIMEAAGLHFEDEARNPFRLLLGLGYRFRDARSGEWFASLDQMQSRFRPGDWEMTESINVVATSAAAGA